MILIQQVDAQGSEVERVKRKVGENEKVFLSKQLHTAPHLEKVEVLFTYGKEITEDILKKMQRLRWIQLTSTGFDHLPLSYIQKQGIRVTTIKGAHVKPIAEYAFSCMLYFSRKMDHFISLQKSKTWDRFTFPTELSEKTLVILGTGRIGQEIARKAQAFDMNIIGVNRSGRKIINFNRNYSVKELDNILPLADYLVLSLPYTNETYHIIGEKELKYLKSTAVLINLGRGELMDEDAARKVMERGKLRGMALDVFSKEPLPKESPVWGTPDILVTPHMAAKSDRFLDRCLDIFLKNYLLYKDKKEMINEAEISKGY